MIFRSLPQYTFAVPQNKIPHKPMKKLVLLFGLLLPLFGFSQVDLVRWNGANVQPNAFLIVNNGTITAPPVSGNFVTDNYSDPFPGFRGSGYNYVNSSDENNYIGFQFTTNSSTNVAMNNFKFTYARGEGGATKFEVKYSTNGATWISKGITTGVSQTPTLKTISLTDVNVAPGTTFYIRVYPFARENQYWTGGTFHIKHGTTEPNATPNATGPTLSGTVTTVCTPPANTQAFGDNEWNGYVYTYTADNTNFETATYIGTVKEDKIFERNVGAGAVDGRPGSRNIPCVSPLPSDKFMVRYKMKLTITEATKYNFTVTGDDGFRLFVDDLTTPLVNGWTNNKSTNAGLKDLSVGTHNLILEYFEGPGNSELIFTYGKIAGDFQNYPFGVNEWKAYGFSTCNQTDYNLTLDSNTYAGYYTQSTLDSELVWNQNGSPSKTLVANVWNGAPVHNYNYTLSYRRQGFKCGTYQLKMDKWDDAAAVYIYDSNNVATKVWEYNGYSGGISSSNQGLKNIGLPMNLSSTSKIEVRMKNKGGDGSVKLVLIETPVTYTGASINDIQNTSIKIDSDITINGRIDVCSCTVASGKTLKVNPNSVLNVQEDITVQGTGKIIIEDKGSLVQINNDAIYIGDATSFVMKRTTAPVKRYDFTYWSSPVIGETLYDLSPNTLGDKYYSYNPVSGWMIHYNGNEVMAPGKGYIVRAPQEYDINNPAVYNATFTGKPNNGIIAQAIVANASNLIGNPYPSAISADAIYNANSDKIGGTFYFWTHNSLPSSANSGNATYNYSSDDYASYNVLGGVKTKSAITGGQSPTGNIGAGQSFFIAGKTSANLTFSNSMRAKNAGDNSQFFRISNTTQSEDLPVTIEKSRLWLNISNEAGDFNETLVGYISNATNGMDEAFDGANLSSGNTTLYSIIDSNNLVIQGRALPFTNTDVVPLGMKISTAGQYTINMDQFDGLFLSQNIYLFDSLTNTTHDLKASDYVFNSEAGTFNSRFEIRYVNGTELGIDTPIVSNNDVVVYKSGNQIAVRATNFTIETVQVYDITGKLLTSGKNVNNNTFSTTGLNVATQVVIVKVTLDDNQTVSKKVIMN